MPVAIVDNYRLQSSKVLGGGGVQEYDMIRTEIKKVAKYQLNQRKDSIVERLEVPSAKERL